MCVHKHTQVMSQLYVTWRRILAIHMYVHKHTRYIYLDGHVENTYYREHILHT